MKSLAQKYNIRVTWFYGEPGHERGLVDAMSSFGCKAPLRNAIVTADLWLDNAYEMKDYLDQIFVSDSSKNYFVISEETTARKRRLTKGEHVIKGCRKLHMISVNPNGEFTSKIVLDTLDSDLMSLKFDEFDEERIPTEISDIFEDDFLDKDDLDVENNCDVIDLNALFTLVSVDTFVALRSPPNSMESFYIVKIVSKDIADTDITDDFGHIILQGEKFISGYYLNRLTEGKSGVKFYLPKKPKVVYIHLKEIFSIDVQLSPSLTMDIVEFNALNQQLY